MEMDLVFGCPFCSLGCSLIGNRWPSGGRREANPLQPWEERSAERELHTRLLFFMARLKARAPDRTLGLSGQLRFRKAIYSRVYGSLFSFPLQNKIVV